MVSPSRLEQWHTKTEYSKCRVPPIGSPKSRRTSSGEPAQLFLLRRGTKGGHYELGLGAVTLDRMEQSFALQVLVAFVRIFASRSFSLKRRSATYQGLSFEVDADIRAFGLWGGGFIHWLELEAQWHTRNSTTRLGNVTHYAFGLPTPRTISGSYSLSFFHIPHNTLA